MAQRSVPCLVDHLATDRIALRPWSTGRVVYSRGGLEKGNLHNIVEMLNRGVFAAPRCALSRIADGPDHGLRTVIVQVIGRAGCRLANGTDCAPGSLGGRPVTMPACLNAFFEGS